MKEIIAVMRPEKWRSTREAADALGAQEIVRQRVLGRGRQRGLRYLRPSPEGGETGILYLTKQMVVWIVGDEEVDDLVTAIIRANQTGNYGDGKIFVCPLECASDIDIREV